MGSVTDTRGRGHRETTSIRNAHKLLLSRMDFDASELFNQEITGTHLCLSFMNRPRDVCESQNKGYYVASTNVASRLELGTY
jgi:hypothetical protein